MTRRKTDDAVVLERFHAHLPFAESRAAVMYRWVASRGYVTLDDLQGFAREGLLAAARSFDDSRGVEFGAWAETHVRGAMRRGIRLWRSSGISTHGGDAIAGSRRSRSMVRSESGFTDDEPSPAEVGPEALAMRVEEVRRVRDAVRRLPERERRVVECRDLDELGAGKASAMAGISRPWAHRLRTSAFATLSAELAAVA